MGEEKQYDAVIMPEYYQIHFDSVQCYNCSKVTKIGGNEAYDCNYCPRCGAEWKSKKES